LPQTRDVLRHPARGIAFLLTVLTG